MKIGVSGALMVHAHNSSVRVGSPHRMISAGTSTAITTTAVTRMAGVTASSRASSTRTGLSSMGAFSAHRRTMSRSGDPNVDPDQDQRPQQDRDDRRGDAFDR